MPFFYCCLFTSEFLLYFQFRLNYLGQAAGGGPCSSGHSHNYCVGWRDGVSGVTEDYDYKNPNQPPGAKGCRNDPKGG
jgi:hypothetical protein